MFRFLRLTSPLAATFAVAWLTVGCGTTTSAAADASVESDVSTTDDSTADAQGGNDVTGATDAVSNDAIGNDASPSDIADTFVLTDAQTGGNDGDLLEVKLGDVTLMDGFVMPDAPPQDLTVFDLGQPDVSIDPKCSILCGVVVAAKCPNDDPLDKCVAGCSMGLAQAPKCAPLMYTMIDCAKGQTLTCDSSGKAGSPPACATEIQAVQDCFKGSTGGCSGGNTCAADSQGNCGCNGCVGAASYGMDCQGGTCTCTLNNAPTSKTFPADTVCQNPGPVMDANCKPAP